MFGLGVGVLSYAVHFKRLLRDRFGTFHWSCADKIREALEKNPEKNSKYFEPKQHDKRLSSELIYVFSFSGTCWDISAY